MKDFKNVLFWIVVFVLACGNVVYTSFVFALAWKWLLVPIGLPIISVAQAFGVSLMVKYFTLGLARTPDKDDDDTLSKETKALKGLTKQFVTSNVFLLIAFVASLFI